MHHAQDHTARISPYNPQSDGMLERWHAFLKAMIRNQNRTRGIEIVFEVSLFAYRDIPHATTGYSLFQLQWMEYRGHLEVLKNGWVEGGAMESDLLERVEKLREKLTSMAEIARQRKTKEKQTMKANYDKHTKPKQ